MRKEKSARGVVATLGVSALVLCALGYWLTNDLKALWYVSRIRRHHANEYSAYMDGAFSNPMAEPMENPVFQLIELGKPSIPFALRMLEDEERFEAGEMIFLSVIDTFDPGDSREALADWERCRCNYNREILPYNPARLREKRRTWEAWWEKYKDAPGW